LVAAQVSPEKAFTAYPKIATLPPSALARAPAGDVLPKAHFAGLAITPGLPPPITRAAFCMSGNPCLLQTPGKIGFHFSVKFAEFQ